MEAVLLGREGGADSEGPSKQAIEVLGTGYKHGWLDDPSAGCMMLRLTVFASGETPLAAG